MNKNNIIIVVLVLLVGLGGYYAFTLFENEETELSAEPMSDFQIKDTASVDKIRITEKDIGSITLVRGKNDNHWYIEGTDQKAQPYNANLILETAFQIQVKQNVSAELKETVLTQLSVRHKKVEYYFNGESQPRKTWFVGNGTTDHMGTFMLLENYDQSSGKSIRSPEPYIMHKPGMHGTLDTRFFTGLSEWTYPGVFNYDIKDIKSIQVDFGDRPDESYAINISADGIPELLDNNNILESKSNLDEVKHYVTHYRNIFYESFVQNMDQKQMDSTRSSKPHVTITVTDRSDQSTSATLWRIPKADSDQAAALNPLAYDVGRAYCSINNGKQLVKIQYFSWDVLLKPKSFFLPKAKQDLQY